MSRRRSSWLVAVVIVLLAALGVVGASAAPPPAATDPTAVTHWNRVATSTLVAFPGAASGAPPALQINLGMVQGAVYDAVNAITPKHHRPYLLKRRFSGSASGEAAVATAASRVLTHIISTVPASIPFANRGALLQAVADARTASLAPIPDNSFKRQGIDAGNAAADAMIAARQGDGRFGPSPWVPNPDPGHWDPVAPNGTVVQDPTPWVGGVEPFLMQSSSQFRSPGPNALTSAAYTADFNEVKALGGDGVVTPSARMPTETHNAIFWQSAGGPALLWSGVARNLAEDPAMGLDLADSARLLAMMNLSGADAAINCWNDKYHFDFWRPFQAIRRAGEPAEGNPDTLPDPTWTPLFRRPTPTTRPGTCASTAHISGRFRCSSAPT